MTKTEALEAFAKNDGRPVKVQSRGGVVYWLYEDVVECGYTEGVVEHGYSGEDVFVYGDMVNPHHRVKATHRWFWLRNVSFYHGD